MRLTTTQNKYICEIIKTQTRPSSPTRLPVPQPTSLASENGF